LRRIRWHNNPGFDRIVLEKDIEESIPILVFDKGALMEGAKPLFKREISKEVKNKIYLTKLFFSVKQEQKY
jgi:hypothetical protein